MKHQHDIGNRLKHQHYIGDRLKYQHDIGKRLKYQHDIGKRLKHQHDIGNIWEGEQVAYCVGSGNISDGGSPRANENRINIHFVRYTSEMRALFVSPHLYILTIPGGKILFFHIGINIYFVRNTHLLHRRNIICRTEDT